MKAPAGGGMAGACEFGCKRPGPGDSQVCPCDSSIDTRQARHEGGMAVKVEEKH